VVCYFLPLLPILLLLTRRRSKLAMTEAVGVLKRHAKAGICAL
jgi:hypothetical protein